jgi:hypothetical protein
MLRRSLSMFSTTCLLAVTGDRFALAHRLLTNPKLLWNLLPLVSY